MDETYIKVHGQWVYLYRAVDKAGQTVDFFLSRNRDVSPQRDEEHSRTQEDHVGRLWGFASRGAGNEADRRASAAGEGPLQPVLEQPGGAGPSPSEATNPAHAGVQAIRQRGGDDFWDRVGRED